MYGVLLSSKNQSFAEAISFQEFDVIFLSETSLTSLIPNRALLVTCFQIYRGDRPSEKIRLATVEF